MLEDAADFLWGLDLLYTAAHIDLSGTIIAFQQPFNAFPFLAVDSFEVAFTSPTQVTNPDLLFHNKNAKMGCM